MNPIKQSGFPSIQTNTTGPVSKAQNTETTPPNIECPAKGPWNLCLTAFSGTLSVRAKGVTEQLPADSLQSISNLSRDLANSPSLASPFALR